MYSKNRGITYGTRRVSAMGDRPPVGREPVGREPAYRQPAARQRMQVPLNYSGHAIVDGEERPLGSMGDTVGDTVSSADLPTDPNRDTPTPRFDGLPRVSELGDAHRRPSVLTVPATFEVTPAEEPEEPDPPPPEAETPPPASDGARPAGDPPSVPAVARPKEFSLFDPSHFPFGHGFGFEEILILGLILFLLRESADCEDRGDLDETVILLGLLLLLG